MTACEQMNVVLRFGLWQLWKGGSAENQSYRTTAPRAPFDVFSIDLAALTRPACFPACFLSRIRQPFGPTLLYPLTLPAAICCQIKVAYSCVTSARLPSCRTCSSENEHTDMQEINSMPELQNVTPDHEKTPHVSFTSLTPWLTREPCLQPFGFCSGIIGLLRALLNIALNRAPVIAPVFYVQANRTGFGKEAGETFGQS